MRIVAGRDPSGVCFVRRWRLGHLDTERGSDLRQLTNDPAADSWPVWSPDGRSIAFGTVRDGVLQTWLVPSQGGPGQKLVDGFFRGDWVEQVGGAGTRIVTSNSADGIRLIDVEKRSVLWPGSRITPTIRHSISYEISH